MITKAIIKAIKGHKAYNLNMAREEEVCVTVKHVSGETVADSLFTLDDWGVLEGDFGNVSLKTALDWLLESDNTWYIRGI